MNRTPVGIENRRKVDDLTPDETSEYKDDRSERQRKRRNDTKLPAPDHQQRCYAGTERECQAEVIEIGERNIPKYPWHIRCVCTLSVKDLNFPVIRRDPSDEPTRKVKKHAEGSRP